MGRKGAGVLLGLDSTLFEFGFHVIGLFLRKPWAFRLLGLHFSS